MVKKLIKICVYLFFSIAVFFVGMDLLLSDFGPGENSTTRIVYIGMYVLVSGVIFYIMKRLLKKF